MAGPFSEFLEFAGNFRDVVVIIDGAGTLLAGSSSATELLGYDIAEHIGRNIAEYVHPDDLARASSLLATAVQRAGMTVSVDIRVRHAAGHHIPFEILPRNLLSTRGVVVLTGRDITDRQALQATSRRTDQQFQTLATAAPVAIFRLDADGQCAFMNDHWMKISEQPAADAVGFGYLKVIAPTDREVLYDVQRTRSPHGAADITVVSVSGRTRSAVARWTEIQSDDGLNEGWVGTLEDVSEHRALQARLSHQATHDPLTGLPNRIILHDHLARAVDRPPADGTGVAVVFIDLDQFKFVNDSLGHATGDNLLVAVAERLRETVRPGDVVGRFGGDEFVAVVTEATNESAGQNASARIVRALSAPFTLGASEAYICTASIGIALWSPGASAGSMLRDADSAMYRAKALGRNRVEVYTPDMQSRASERLTLEMDLRTAVHTDELIVLYQPILSTETGRTNAVEALVRWDHPTRGRLAPDTFIPIAEESGVIVALGERVLTLACREIGPYDLALNVNLSGRQVQDPHLVDMVARVLAQEHFPPERLVLEITESVLMGDAQATAVTLTKLKELGIAIAVDDFGTGYASLSYLSRFPVDCLKVDRAFVAGLGSRAGGNEEIVRAVVNLAHSLGLVATAEGVEETDQLAALQALGCENVQGFLFARPLSLDDLRQHLAVGVHQSVGFNQLVPPT